jgi:predicted metal-binding membrane protein
MMNTRAAEHAQTSTAPEEPRMPPQPSQRAFLAVSAMLFVSSATLTVLTSSSMAAMGAMPMDAGWTLSMAWMRMPGQTWTGMAASFLGMWLIMMVAMMLPSLVSMLWTYREALASQGCRRLGRPTMLAALGYLLVWALIGVLAFPLGSAVAALEMHVPLFARAEPSTVALITVLGGVLQFSAWKARHLNGCRRFPAPAHQAAGRSLRTGVGSAWRHGLHLGVHCARCCAGLTAILLAVGVMNLRAMALVAAAITAERLAPAGRQVARIIGGVLICVGLVLLAQAWNLG